MGIKIFSNLPPYIKDISNNVRKYEDGTDRGSETSAIRIQTPGNYPKENILHIEHGESLKSRMLRNLILFMIPTYTFCLLHRRIIYHKLIMCH